MASKRVGMSPPVNDAITNEPANQGENPVPSIEQAIDQAAANGDLDRVDYDARLQEWRAKTSPLLLEVRLSGKDSEAVRAMAEEEYRTPAQQVGWIVSRWLKERRPGSEVDVLAKMRESYAKADQDRRAPSEPRLIPVYHKGDGSAGSGCGKVGLLFARPLEGKTIGPGDVFKTDETPWTKEDGPLTCCQCGGAMVPSTWTYDL